MDLVDAHCHIQEILGHGGIAERWHKAGITDIGTVIAEAAASDVRQLLCVGTTLADSQLAVEVAEKHANCYAAVGVHPHEAKTVGEQDFKKLGALAGRPKVVAIGECGLDYFYEHSPRQKQEQLLKWHMELALERNLPIIFHVREAFDDFWPIFERYQGIRGVLHSFTDSAENLARALEHGLYIGVNGIATFAKNPAQQEVYKAIPLNRLLLETDAPFLTPVPYRGKICTPKYVRTTAEYLANLRGESLEALASATTQSAQKLFGLKNHELKSI